MLSQRWHLWSVCCEAASCISDSNLLLQNIGVSSSTLDHSQLSVCAQVAGLWNEGLLCYRNASIQALACVPEIWALGAAEEVTIRRNASVLPALMTVLRHVTDARGAGAVVDARLVQHAVRWCKFCCLQSRLLFGSFTSQRKDQSMHPAAPANASRCAFWGV